MSTCITLPFWPTCLDNLRWSHDNLIAVAGSESIAILIPKTKTRPASDARWDHIILKVNAFTLQELPQRPTVSFDNWSLGEELSLRHVLSMDWSPPGLGCFGACVLAILHTDHALDLWEFIDNPDSKDNWRRCLVVTHAVHDYYHNTYPAQEQPPQTYLEQQQVRQRIRSFAWGSCVAEDSFEELRACEQGILLRTTQHLAVATDAGDILILEISSAYNILSDVPQRWHADVLHRISCSEHMSVLDHADPATLETIHESNSYATIDWLIWDNRSGQDVFAFIISGMLCIIHCDLRNSSGSQRSARGSNVKASPQQLTPTTMKVEGPLRLSPDGTTVLCFAGDELVAHKIHRPDTAEVGYETHHVDRRWSEMSGLAVAPHGSSTARAMFTTHLGYERLKEDTAVIGATQDTIMPLQTTFQDDLQNAAKHYQSKLSLGMEPHIRTWGVAIAPTGSDVVVCSNMVPADSVAHIIMSDQESVVFIHELWQFGASDTPSSVVLPRWEIPECPTFALQRRYFVARDEAPQDQPDEQLVRHMLHDFRAGPTAIETDEHTTIMQRDPASAAIHRLRLQVLWRPDRYEFMQRRLLACILQRPCTPIMPNEWYQALGQEVQAIAMHLPKGQLSHKIVAMYQQVLGRLAQAQTDGVQTSTAESVVENCTVCQEEMPFEALRWTRCSSGHRFVRCALTFLTIPRPGISKTCNICGIQYLNERRLPGFGIDEESAINGDENRGGQTDTAMAGADDDQTSAVEPTKSVARVLFSVFHRCILCNGRFMA